MFTADAEWRKEFGTDTILDDFHFHERDAFISVYPQGYHKTDKMVGLLRLGLLLLFGTPGSCPSVACHATCAGSFHDVSCICSDTLLQKFSAVFRFIVVLCCVIMLLHT